MLSRLTLTLFALAVFSALAPAARADLKLVQKVTSSGTGTMAGKSRATIKTLYCKGSKTRREQRGRVEIYDGTSGKRLLLNTARKTYRVVQAGFVLSEKDDRQIAAMQFETAATVTPGGQTRVIGGKTARNYLAKVTLSAMPPAGAKMKPSRQRFTVLIETELWTTEAVKAISPLQSAMAGLGSGAFAAGMKPLAEAFSKVKGTTLAATQKMTVGMSASASSGASTIGTSVAATELISLSEAPLPDALFAVPGGYTREKEVP